MEGPAATTVIRYYQDVHSDDPTSSMSSCCSVETSFFWFRKWFLLLLVAAGGYPRGVVPRVVSAGGSFVRFPRSAGGLHQRSMPAPFRGWNRTLEFHPSSFVCLLRIGPSFVAPCKIQRAIERLISGVMLWLRAENGSLLARAIGCSING